MKSLKQLARPQILALKAYDNIRELEDEERKIFLDANENPFNKPYSRYPDTNQTELKKALSEFKGVKPESIFLGNGTMDIVDIIYRCFLNPGVDNVVSIEPTRSIYKRCADIYGVEYKRVLLDEKFQISAEKLLASKDENTKIIWICSPNDPTGNSLSLDEIVKTIVGFDGLVVLDEAYSDFSSVRSLRHELRTYPNLIILNTFSSSFSSATIRLAMAFARKEIINIFSRVAPKYNVNGLTLEYALKLLKSPFAIEKWTRDVVAERGRMVQAFNLLPFCQTAYPTDANFFLVRMNDSKTIYDYLVSEGIYVRDCSNKNLLDNCLRITVGTMTENTRLLSLLRKF